MKPTEKTRQGKTFSDRYEQVLLFALKAHAGQCRKGGCVPYVSHVVHVARILDLHGLPEDVVLAGLLHDVLEDCEDYTPDNIRTVAGETVLALVEAVTETKQDGDGSDRPWRTRKLEQHAHLRTANKHVAALKAADALHNLRTLLADIATHGPGYLDRFNAPPRDTLWNYTQVAALLGDRLGREHPLVAELHEAVGSLHDVIQGLVAGETSQGPET